MRVEIQLHLPTSQNFPLYPSGHTHWKEERLGPFLQEPPFWQGLGLQGEAVGRGGRSQCENFETTVWSEKLKKKWQSKTETFLAGGGSVRRFALALVEGSRGRENTAAVAAFHVLANIFDWKQTIIIKCQIQYECCLSKKLCCYYFLSALGGATILSFQTCFQFNLSSFFLMLVCGCSLN